MGARFETLRLEQPVLRPQLGQPPLQLRPNRRDGALDGRALRDEVRRRIHGAAVQVHDGVTRQGIDLCDALDGVAPEFHAHALLVVRREDFHRVPADTEGAALECYVVALVLNPHQVREQRVPAPLLSHCGGHHQLAVQLRVAQAVDRGHARHDDDVVPLHQARGGTEPEAVDVVVNRGILGDIGVGLRDVRFRLVVIVI